MTAKTIFLTGALVAVGLFAINVIPLKTALIFGGVALVIGSVIPDTTTTGS